MQSLDKFNVDAEEFGKKIRDFKKTSDELKERIGNCGFVLAGDEMCKISLLTKQKGYTGTEIAQILEENGIYPEFYDNDGVVLMISPENNRSDFELLVSALENIKTREAIDILPPDVFRGEKAMSLRDAVFSVSENIPVGDSLGRICADTALQCPPAIPIVALGERISEEHINALKYYVKMEIRVVKE